MELLVVMGIAVILLGLAVMGMRGSGGTASRRSAVGTLMGVLDQTRAIAISDGRAAYVVFVSSPGGQSQNTSVPPEMWGRAYAIFEDPVLVDTMDDKSFTPRQLSTWSYLPTGIAFKCGDNGNSTSPSLTAILPTDKAFAVPKVGGGTVSLSLPYVKFDVTGQIVGADGTLFTPTPPPLHVLIFEGTANGAGVETFTRRAAVNGTDGQKYALDEILLKPTTGRAQYNWDPAGNLTSSN